MTSNKIRIGNKSKPSTNAINPNPFRNRPSWVEVTVFGQSHPKVFRWVLLDSESSPTVEESIEHVFKTSNFSERVIQEARLSGAVGLIGLADLAKAQKQLQSALSILGGGNGQTPKKNLERLLKGVEELTKGLIQVTVGQQKVLGTLVYQSSTKSKRR